MSLTTAPPLGTKPPITQPTPLASCILTATHLFSVFEGWTSTSKSTTPSDSSEPSSGMGNGFPGIGLGISLSTDGDIVVHKGGVKCTWAEDSGAVRRLQKYTEARRESGVCGDTGGMEPCDTYKINFEGDIDDGMGNTYVREP
jgi:hypothetical protein